MTQTIKNVVMVGASGSIGSSIFKALLNSGNFQVSVLARPESTNTYSANIKVIVSDYTEDSLVASFKGQDAVVSALGAAGLSEEIKLIDAAVKAGVKRFIPSEFSCDAQNKQTAELIPVFGLKVRTHEHLKAQEVKGLSWTSIPAGPAFDLGLNIGLSGFNINTRSATIYDGGNIPFSTSNLSQIGNAVVSVLLHPAETANKTLYIESFTATQNEILAELEKATGEKWKVTEASTESAKARGQELFFKGDFSGLLLLLQVITFGKGFGSNFREDAVLSNEELGLPKQDLGWSVASLVEGTSS